MHSVLIADESEISRATLARLLKESGVRILPAASGEEARILLQSERCALAIIDLELAGDNASGLLAEAAGAPVVLTSADTRPQTVVRCMKMGATDFLAKPIAAQEVRRLAAEHLADHFDPQPDANDPAGEFHGMLGSGPRMQALFARIRKIAPTEATVLVQGETGTGKELAARALHRLGGRRQAPLVSLNCAAIPDSLIESELFGHEKGAFTGAVARRKGLVEAADGGTLFLDEIGELPAEAQARLLRVLQEGEVRRVGSVQQRHVDIRVIAATHRDLEVLVEQGRFREDLFYRLNVLDVCLPPLRERGSDIVLLANHFLAAAAERLGRPRLFFSVEALAALRAHDWPGNVRELENVVQRACVLAESDCIGVEMLGAAAPRRPVPEADTARGGRLSLEEYIQQFLVTNQGRMTETEIARRLGISRKCLWEKRQKLGIPRRRTADGRES